MLIADYRLLQYLPNFFFKDSGLLEAPRVLLLTVFTVPMLSPKPTAIPVKE